MKAKLVQYNIEDEFQCRVGKVIKEGSKRIFVRERNISNPEITHLNIKDNKVVYLFRAKNKFDKVKGSPR